MKKDILSCILLIAVSAGYAQTRLTLIVKANSGTAITSVDFMNFAQTHKTSATYGDTMHLNLVDSDADFYNIRFIKKNSEAWTQLWLDTGNITIRGKVEEGKFIIDTVIGSQLYYSVKDFYRQSAIIGLTKDTAAINEYLVKAFREHLQDPFSGFILSRFLKINANNSTEVARLYGWVLQQKEVIKMNLAVAGFFTAIENMMNKEPLNFDGFGFIDRNNRKTAIEFKGASFYVLDLWYTSCAPCVKEHLEIAANLEKLNAAGVALIGISTDTKYTVWKKYLDRHRYGWSNYMIDPRGKNWIEEKRYASFPGYIILSSDLKILAYFGHIDHVLAYFKVTK